MIRGALCRGTRISWEEIRANAIQELCGAQGAMNLVRGEVVVAAHLDNLIQAEKKNVSQRALVRLASLLDLRGDHEEALALLDNAHDLHGVNFERLPPPARFLREIVARHASWARERERLAAPASDPSGVGTRIAVEVLAADAVSTSELDTHFLARERPCVLRGPPVAPRWTPEELCMLLGHRQVPLMQSAQESLEWARIQFAGSAPFADFVAQEVTGHDGVGRRLVSGTSPVLFDYSVWQHCADAVAEQVWIPRWFCTDILSQAYACMRPVSGSASPTLFVAPAGTFTSMHVDFLRTHFWMMLCSGRKRWRLVPPGDLACLYPRYLLDLNPVFPFSLDEVAQELQRSPSRFPALAHIAVHEVVLEPGDILFIPEGWAHQVENLEASVALSANFVDSTNYPAAVREAEILSLLQKDSGDLAEALRDAYASGTLERLENTVPLDHLPLRTFKERHGEARAPFETRRAILRASGAIVLLCVVACGATFWSIRGGRSVAAG